MLRLLEVSEPVPDARSGGNSSVISLHNYLKWPFRHVSIRHMQGEVAEIAAIINIALTTNDSPLWFVCGQIAPANSTAMLNSLDSKEVRGRVLKASRSSLRLLPPDIIASRGLDGLTAAEAVGKRFTNINLTALPGAPTPAPSDGVPYGGAELGYTCGLWLMLHYFTGMVEWGRVGWGRRDCLKTAS